MAIMIPSIRWVLLAVFAVLLVVGYLCRRRPWGRALIVACVLGVLGVLAYQLFFRGQSNLRVASVARATSNTTSARLIGQGLKSYLAPESRIVVMAQFSPQVRPSWPMLWSSWQKGLSEGLADTSWKDAGYVGPAPGTAQSLSEGLAAVEGQVDAIVSFAGLPDDLEQMSIYASGTPPKVAAYFPINPNREAIRRWLKDGLIQAAVMDEKGVPTLYTRDKLP